MRSPGKLAVSSTSKFPLAIWLLVEEMSSMTPLRIFWLVRSASLMLPISLAPRNSTAIFRSPWLMASMALLAWSSGGTMARMMRTTMKNTNRTASTSTATKKIMVVVLLRACFWMASQVWSREPSLTKISSWRMSAWVSRPQMTSAARGMEDSSL